MPGHELVEVGAAADFAVLPVGAVEWHGPHLPLGTDLFSPKASRRIVVDGGLRAVVFPAVPYAACPGQTRPWPGTVAVRPEIAVAYLSDVIVGIVGPGFPRVLVVNGHDANMSTVRAAMEWVSGRHRRACCWSTGSSWSTPAETDEMFGELPSRGHGGAYETSGVLGFHAGGGAPGRRRRPAAAGETADGPPVRPRRVATRPVAGLVRACFAGHRRGRPRVRGMAGARLREILPAWVAAPLPGPPTADPVGETGP